jgi:hypothetical protein
MQLVLNKIIGNLTSKDLHLTFANQKFASFQNDPMLLLKHIKTRKNEDYDIEEDYFHFFWPSFNNQLDTDFIDLAQKIPDCVVTVIKIINDSDRDIDDDVTGADDQKSYIALVAPDDFPMFKSRGPEDHVISIVFNKKYYYLISRSRIIEPSFENSSSEEY